MHNARDSPIKYLQGEQAAGRTVCLKQFRNKEIESPPHAEFEWSVATQSAKEQGKPRNEDAETPSKSSLLLDFSFLRNKQSTRKRNALILLVSVLRITRLTHAHIIGLILEMIKPRRLDIRSLQFDYTSHRLAATTHHIHIVALVVVHLHVQHSLHLLSDVHGDRVLQAEAALVPVRARRIGSRGENNLGGRSLEVDVEPARQSVEKSYE